MKLRIRHVTRYRYRCAVTLLPHRLMLIPRGTQDLRVLSTSLEVVPAAGVEWTQDVFGNLVATAIFADPTNEIMITSEMEVEQVAAEWPLFRIAPGAHTFPFRYSDEDIADLGALLHPQHPDKDGKLATWASRFVLGSSTDTLSLLKDINFGVSRAVSYRIRDEEGTQSPHETLEIASGSCRDMSALFIEAVRHLGFGARAVSGYLYDPDAAAADRGSTHAWAEVYLPAAGWIAFDPTHGRVGSARLVAVAVGRYNGQIMPVTGGYVGLPDAFEAMDVCVSVDPACAMPART
jgi:transglutaminase-like putative cysteine protease